MNKILSVKISVIFLLAVLVFGLSKESPAQGTVDQQASMEKYREILDLYAAAEAGQWTSEQYRDHNLALIYGWYHMPAGYCFADINQDTVPELLMGTPGTYEGDPRYGSVFALYTLSSEKPVMLEQRDEMSTIFVCEDGTIGYHAISGPEIEWWEFYTLPQYGSELSYQGVLGFDPDKYSDEIWYKMDAPSSDHSDDVLMSEEEAMALIDSYKIMDLDFLPVPDNTAGYDVHSAFYGIWCMGTKDPGEADRYAHDLQAQGYPAEVYLTTDWSNLNPEPWYVVSAGEYPTEESANNNLGWVRQVCSDAYVKWSGDYVGH